MTDTATTKQLTPITSRDIIGKRAGIGSFVTVIATGETGEVVGVNEWFTWMVVLLDQKRGERYKGTREYPVEQLALDQARADRLKAWTELQEVNREIARIGRMRTNLNVQHEELRKRAEELEKLAK